MAHRQFTDARHLKWDVWEVEPSHAERRLAERDRRQTPRATPDRRQVTDAMRVRISTRLTDGWLAFQAKHEKRRLSPVPDGWEQLDDAGLERLLAMATVSGRPRRLVE
jgi:hypothetical protein